MYVASLLLAGSALFTAVPDLFGDGSAESTMAFFNFFRFVGGIGVGLCSVASPMYIAEIAPPSRRGSMGLTYQLAIVVGHAVAPLVAFGIVYFLRTTYGVTETIVSANKLMQPWRWMFISEMVFVVTYIGFLRGLPFSPRWLAKKERFEEAEATLSLIDGPAYARREIEDIRATLHEERGAWSELLRPGIRKALAIGILLTFFNNWTGWSVIGGYIPRLLQLAGFDREQAIGNFVAVYGAMALMTLASIILMDYVGRRPLWMAASLLMALITAATGYMFYNDVSGWPVLILLGLVTVPHGLALDGIPWLMMSELFPTRLRARAVAVTTTVLWVFIFAGAYLFPMITGYSQREFLTAREAVVSGAGISFVAGQPNAILDSKGRFLEAKFQVKDQITVVGATSPENNGTYVVTGVEKGRLVLDGPARLRSEPGNINTKVQVGSAAAAFYLFSMISMLSFLFGLWIMPETKGRTLEEIGGSWERLQKHTPSATAHSK